MFIEFMGYIIKPHGYKPQMQLPRSYLLPTITFIQQADIYEGYKTRWIMMDFIWLKWMYSFEIDILKK